MDHQSALIIKATADAEFCEIEALESAFKYHDIDVTQIDLTSHGDGALEHLRLQVPLAKTDWSFVYVCGHGDAESVGDNSTVDVSWFDFSSVICNHITSSTVLMVACCRGGYNTVAYYAFAGCESLDVVVGPRFFSYQR